MSLPTAMLAKVKKSFAADTDITIGGDLTVTGDTSITGDVTATGGDRTILGPFTVTTAADETDTQLVYGAAATHEFVAIRAGSVVGLSAQLSAAITHAGDGTLDVEIAINGTPIVSGPTVQFTDGGAEVALSDTAAKDAAGHTYAAGALISVVYTSNTITNTPTLNVYVEVEQ